MAESFSNYCSSFNFSTSSTGEYVIVPKAGYDLTQTGTGSRPPGAVTQLHSIYLTQRVSRYYADPTEATAFINIKVKDSSGSYYIAQNIMVLPHSAFYIEKTITLLTQQQLVIEYTSLNTTSKTIDCVCSGVDIVS